MFRILIVISLLGTLVYTVYVAWIAEIIPQINTNVVAYMPLETRLLIVWVAVTLIFGFALFLIW